MYSRSERLVWVLPHSTPEIASGWFTKARAHVARRRARSLRTDAASSVTARPLVASPPPSAVAVATPLHASAPALLASPRATMPQASATASNGNAILQSRRRLVSRPPSSIAASPPSSPSSPACRPCIAHDQLSTPPMPMPLPMPMPVPVPVRASASLDASHDASRNAGQDLVVAWDVLAL